MVAKQGISALQKGEVGMALQYDLSAIEQEYCEALGKLEEIGARYLEDEYCETLHRLEKIAARYFEAGGKRAVLDLIQTF
jgi:hypothetical protein